MENYDSNDVTWIIKLKVEKNAFAIGLRDPSIRSPECEPLSQEHCETNKNEEQDYCKFTHFIAPKRQEKVEDRYELYKMTWKIGDIDDTRLVNSPILPLNC
ncbi:hypothetical protein NECAME_16897 [Necator americanus]|uniref:Uncharacterized protein n=1 Tax=Necator americanus TaxID=51031 RepID=W2TSR6_NECAM|nr:hypothetical protein NECAME_16897 [Necator americanus]ETN85130.1 hypothetical protein NECAME_16897 [Necator americanus]